MANRSRYARQLLSIYTVHLITGLALGRVLSEVKPPREGRSKGLQNTLKVSDSTHLTVLIKVRNMQIQF
jgi:hypothetical protein